MSRGGHSGPNFPVKNSPEMNQPGRGISRDETIVHMAKVRWWRKRIRHYVERFEGLMNYEEAIVPITKTERIRPSFKSG